MSLDVYLVADTPTKVEPGSGIFVRENGATREISRAEWDEKFPGREPVVALHRDEETCDIYHANITHNLGEMADEAGIYKQLWYPEEIGISKAAQLIEPLTAGLEKLKANPKYFRRFDSPNGWGVYENFVPFVENYLEACQQFPEANVRVSR